jgi:hypothetical protein
MIARISGPGPPADRDVADPCDAKTSRPPLMLDRWIESLTRLVPHSITSILYNHNVCSAPGLRMVGFAATDPCLFFFCQIVRC